VDWTALRSSDNPCNVFGMRFYHIYVTTDVTAIVVTYRQIENNHTGLVNEINTPIDVIARPKSSLCTHTSPSMPRHVVLAHIITVIM
jgi:ABC-type sugar transport system ATPase subunit